MFVPSASLSKKSGLRNLERSRNEAERRQDGQAKKRNESEIAISGTYMHKPHPWLFLNSWLRFTPGLVRSDVRHSRTAFCAETNKHT